MEHFWICGLLPPEQSSGPSTSLVLSPGAHHPLGSLVMGLCLPGDVSCRVCASAMKRVLFLMHLQDLKGLRGEEGKDSGKEGRLVCPEGQTTKCSSAQVSLLNIHSNYKKINLNKSYVNTSFLHTSMTSCWHSKFSLV